MGDVTYLGACFCGSVQLQVSGHPVFQGFCHCESCRHWLGAPMHAATLWPTGSVKVTQGEELLGVYAKTPRSQRQHCKRCGGNVLNGHYDEGTVDVLATVLTDFPFSPDMHIHYQERQIEFPDDLRKYRDLPSEFGGSGELIE